MKKIIIATMMSLTLSSFAQSVQDSENKNQTSDVILSVDGLKELSKSEVVQLVEALEVANNGTSSYGTCNMAALAFNEKAKVYIDEKSVKPLIVGIIGIEWIMITSDESIKNIKSAFIGEYAWKKINNGTLLKPDFQMIRVVISSSSCKSN